MKVSCQVMVYGIYAGKSMESDVCLGLDEIPHGKTCRVMGGGEHLLLFLHACVVSRSEKNKTKLKKKDRPMFPSAK